LAGGGLYRYQAPIIIYYNNLQVTANNTLPSTSEATGRAEVKDFSAGHRAALVKFLESLWGDEGKD
jgi:hypothetical protein